MSLIRHLIWLITVIIKHLPPIITVNSTWRQRFLEEKLACLLKKWSSYLNMKWVVNYWINLFILGQKLYFMGKITSLYFLQTELTTTGMCSTKNGRSFSRTALNVALAFWLPWAPPIPPCPKINNFANHEILLIFITI